MRTPLAWRNLTHHKVRAATSLAAVCVTITLIFMQVGFYDACQRSVVRIFDQLDFDIALVSPQYLSLWYPGKLPRRRLYQAKGVPGVASAAPLYVGNGSWRNPQTRAEYEMVVVGVDPREHLLRLPGLAAKAVRLREEDTVITDTVAQPYFGSLAAGAVTELEGRRLLVVDSYAYGPGFMGNAEVLVSDQTFTRVFAGYPLTDVTVGLVKLRPGCDVAAAVRDLEAALPGDVLVWARPRLEENTIAYTMRVKPLGIIFSSGVVLALVIGAVILYQILASEILSHLREYAALKALGHGNGYLTWVVLQEAVLLAVCGYAPAALLSAGLYAVSRYQTNLPMIMTVPRLAAVLLLAVLMCSLSGILASRRLRRADPMDLFS
jgi:putative ABC transport system permease protein